MRLLFFRENRYIYIYIYIGNMDEIMEKFGILI